MDGTVTKGSVVMFFKLKSCNCLSKMFPNVHIHEHWM